MNLIEGGNVSWVKKVQREALDFAIRGTNSFNIAIRKAAKHMPENTDLNRGRLLNIMIDALVGLTVQMGCHYCGDNIEFEEAVVKNIRHKFKEIRKAKIMGKMIEPEKLSIQEEEGDHDEGA